ncbi:uncharacterized protein HKW66_Vig0103250 [Vigna angularis]|uniref:Proteasome assembly chaperone 3 n=1 Tax=Phaseolus angularis TaxID=3914 RepID=A0A8T0KL97_PHAAN|nr:uncharacterized protein HKW66_Vig0103250 [Vigna angularis]
MNMESSTSQFPVSQLNFSREINGNETEIIISRYEDHFLVSADGVVFYVFMVIVLTFLAAYQVIATQIGTMGTIVYASHKFGVLGVSCSSTFSSSNIHSAAIQTSKSPNIENVIGTHFRWVVHKIFQSLCPQVHVLVKLITLPKSSQVSLQERDLATEPKHTLLVGYLQLWKPLLLKEEGVSINPTFNVSVIFGKRDENVLMQPMLVACARQLIEQMSLSGSSRPLVLSLGLKDHSVETLKGIVSAVTDNSMW